MNSLGREARPLQVFLVGLLALFFVGALAVSWTIPFQEWDAYSIGTWSRFIADGDTILSPRIEQIAHQRPLFPVLQGLVWRTIGHASMRAGRVLSLSFSVLLIVVTFLLARRLETDRTTAWLAAFLAAASPLVSESVSAATSDIPSAALLWTGVLAMLSAREKRSLGFWLLTGVCWSLSALGKVTALALCAGFVAWTAVFGIRRRWPPKAWLAMTVGLALPGYAVYRYWDVVRYPFGWRHFLYGWAESGYYAELARSSRLSTFLHFNWFGILLTLLFATALICAVSRRFRVTALLLMSAISLWAIAARISSPGALREYAPPLVDSLLVGVPAIFVVSALALAQIRQGTVPSYEREREFLIVAALYFVAWNLSLSYDRRFLVAVLPLVAIVAGRWLSLVSRYAAETRSRFLHAGLLLVLLASAAEGARRMDRGYPVFSRHLLATNLRNGLSPEAKMEEIFGPSMRIVKDVQEMIKSNPNLRIISPDTRLPFFFGTSVEAEYPTPAIIGNYDLLVWSTNPGILEQYRVKFGLTDPLNTLKATGRLSEIAKTPEYEVYRISRQ